MADESERLARAAAIGCSTGLASDGAAISSSTGSLDARLPGNLNVSFPGVDGEALLVSLCEDIAVSSGAACTAAEPSHVLKALGRSTELALASLRFGLGRWTTEAEIDAAVARVGDVVIACGRWRRRRARSELRAGGLRPSLVQSSDALLTGRPRARPRPEARRVDAA